MPRALMPRLPAVVLLSLALGAGCQEHRERHEAPASSAAVSSAPVTSGAASRAPAPRAPAPRGGPPIAPTFATLRLVLTGTHPPCNASDCHGPGSANPLHYAVDEPDRLYTELTHHISVDCGKIPVVTPGDPNKSAILKVLRGPCSAKVPQMPFGCSPASDNCVPENYVAAIERWIALGAPKD